MYGVLTETNDFDQWKQFIREHHMGSWVNVYETEAQKKAVEDAKKPSYKQLYDVTQTPTLYLLDKDKKIIAKKLTMEQLNDLLQMKIKNQPLKSVNSSVK